MRARRFLRHFLGAVAAVMALIGAVNLAVDPFDLWGMPRFRGINDVNSVGEFRFVKPLQVERRRPETVILGSSRALHGIDPRDFPEPDRTYDFGIDALTAVEMHGYGRHLLEDTPMRKLVIELSFFEFNDGRRLRPAYSQAILGRSAVPRALPILLFSQEALARSRRTMADSFLHRRRFIHSDGFDDFPFDPSKDPTVEFLKVVDYFAHADSFYRAYASFERPMAEYRALLVAAKAKGVEVVSFIAPEHAALLVTMERRGLWPLYLAWERRLVEVCAEIGVPLWDFSGFNAYTATPMAEGYRTHFDGSHFRPEIGRLMLARMSGAAEPAGFGLRLTPEVLERHLADLEAGRLAYRRAHPEDVARIEAVVDGPPRTAGQ